MSTHTKSELNTLKNAIDSAPKFLEVLGVEETIQAPITETLDQWVSVRFQIEALEAKRREIQPMAIEQLKDLLEAQGKEKGTGYEISGHQVILKTRKSTPKLEDIDGAEAINFELEQEIKSLQEQPRVKEILARVAELQSELETLQAEYLPLVTSPKTVELRKEMEQLVKANTRETEVLELRQIRNGRK